jgi:hypothetical protein
MTDVSLWHIDETLAQLLSYQAERLADTQEPPDEEERATLESEVRKYLEALPAKVDGVAAVLLHMRSRRESIKSEVDRLKALAASVEADEARLKAYVAEILERQPLPKKGPRKLVGSTAELRLVGNGGISPLVIDDEAMIPNEYRTATVTLPYTDWSVMEPLFPEGARCTVAVSNTAVRKGIEEYGGVPGAHIGDRGSRVEIR